MVIDPALRMGLESGVTGRPPACPLSDLFGAGSVRSHYRTKHSETEARI